MNLQNKIVNNKIMFVICGNARTFIKCFESCYDNIITQFNDANDIYIYFYLKLTDPGPKQQENWNFSYDDLKYSDIETFITTVKEKYKLKIYTKLIQTDEISDEEMLKKCISRKNYCGFFDEDIHLVRAMHCHYNFKMCGEFIIEFEKEHKITFDVLFYIRPDLYFTNKCYNDYELKNVICPSNNPIDHLSIIPRVYLNQFFFNRMLVYETNKNLYFNTAEEIFVYTLHGVFITEKIGDFYIKRSI